MISIKNQSNIFLNETLTIKPDYLNHPFVSGNKFRKLKYNLLIAKQLNYSVLLTFGGAYSNHIAAVAAAGHEFGFKTIGVIRGDELSAKISENPTLTFAKNQGMEFYFISRETYKEKTTETFIDALKIKFGDFYLIPEGGTNNLAVKGCEEILTRDDNSFDYICCPVGTGGTISGLINSSNNSQKILGFPSLKGDFLREEIGKFAQNKHWDLIQDYHLGGYAKINTDLISFINWFKATYHIPLDPIYTGKMMFGIFDLLKQGYFPKGSKILAIHTGGLQGIEGMNKILRRKNSPIINLD
ncbi:1-aminocyclopropane-1-carboxylate deaminase [Flavobacteriaceae bacterium LYZ1037]|nr:1-aminocyclopropane-1-carboxylate deaminase [Flavobacteriaceae bacterium LYZ1037]